MTKKIIKIIYTVAFSCSIISANPKPKPVLHTYIPEGEHFVVRSIESLSHHDYVMEMLCRDPGYIRKFYEQMLDLDIAFKILSLHIMLNSEDGTPSEDLPSSLNSEDGTPSEDLPSSLNSEDGTSSPIIETITKLLSRYKVSPTFPPLMFWRGSILRDLESFKNITKENLSLIVGDDIDRDDEDYKALGERLIKQAQNEGYPDSYPFIKKVAHSSIFLMLPNSNGWFWQKRNVSYGKLLSYSYNKCTWLCFFFLRSDICNVWKYILPDVIRYYIGKKDTLDDAISSTLCDLVDYFALDSCDLDNYEKYLLFFEGVIINYKTFFDEYKKHDWKFLPMREGITAENHREIGLELIEQASNDGCPEAAKYLKLKRKKSLYRMTSVANYFIFAL